MGTAVISFFEIVALRNEKGSYNLLVHFVQAAKIVALRNEKGSYNQQGDAIRNIKIVALRNEKGSIQIKKHHLNR